MNASLNFFKNLKNLKNQKFSKNKFLLSLPCLIGFNFFLNNKKSLCYAEDSKSNEPNSNDFNDIYSEFTEDDLAGMGVPQEGLSMEEMQMLKQESQKAQVTPPFSFARIPQLFMNPNDDKWNGVRFTFDWKPTKMYSLEYMASASSLKKLDNFRLSCLNIVPRKFFNLLNL